MRRPAGLGSAVVLGGLPFVAWLAAADPLETDSVRAALARIFEVPAERAGALRVEVEAIENGPEGRLRLPEFESELAALFASHGLPPAPEPDDPAAIAVTCRVGQERVAPDGSGWTQFRWDGSCDVGRRGIVALGAVRAGGEGHPNEATARERARAAARRAMMEALRQRLEALVGRES